MNYYRIQLELGGKKCLNAQIRIALATHVIATHVIARTKECHLSNLVLVN